MSNHFDWITEENGEWESHDVPESFAAHFSKRIILSILLAAAVLVGVGGVVYWQALRRIEVTTTAVSDDIRASYRLFYRAVTEQDSELYNTVLSGRSRKWTAAQQRLLAEGLVLDRQPFGLKWLAGDYESRDVQVSSDFREVEMTAAHRYEGLLQSGQLESVTLWQTAVFRQGRHQWLLSPPPAEFWGRWQTVRGQYFQSSFPTRDDMIVRRLLTDLETNLKQACHREVIDCAKLPDILLRFDTNPGSLSEMTNALNKSSGVVNLPAPSLVGLPVDEAGYQWLRRGYAAHLLAVVMQRQIGWSCCRRGLFFQALLDKQLSMLGLRAWPMTQGEYGRIFHHRITRLHHLRAYWESPPGDLTAGQAWREVYALVDFVLEQESNLSVKRMMAQLTAAGSYAEWLDELMPVSGERLRNKQREWLRFLGEKSQTERPIPLPAQDIQLLCKPVINSNVYLYRHTLMRYEPGDADWLVESADRRFLFMAPLPDDNVVLLQERSYRLDQTRLLLWRAGKEIEFISEPDTSELFRVDQVDAGLLLYSYGTGSRQVSFSLLDVASCEEKECQLFDLNGLPVWSPDGRSTIIADHAGWLWLGDEHGQVETAVSTGTAPFWIDNNRFGYIHLVGSLAAPPAEIVMRSVHRPEKSEILLSLPELAAYLPPDVALDDLVIRGTATHQAHPGRLFLAAAFRQNVAAASEGGFVFQFDMNTGELKLLLTLSSDPGFYKPFVFSPDGRWLTIQSIAGSDAVWQLLLLEAATGRTVVVASDFSILHPAYDWSADGRWLLRIDDGFMQLIAPDFDYQEIIVHDHVVCNFAAWINAP